MPLVRRIARPALASIFVLAGADSLRDPESRVVMAKDALEGIGAQAEGMGLPSDPVTLVRANAAVMIGAGAMLAAGKAPRLSALVLAGTLVPTTLGGHAFWKQATAEGKAREATHFIKNVSVLGGLLLAAVDTAGEPSLGWRAKRAAKDARRGTTRLSRSARKDAERLGRAARTDIARVVDAATDAARSAAASVPGLS